MQELTREVKSNEVWRKDIKALGINSNKVFSIIFEDDSMLNFKDAEVKKILHFLQKHWGDNP